MNKKYLAYLVRFHLGENQLDWRITLQNAHTGDMQYFANEQDFIRYLFKVLDKGKANDEVNISEILD